MPETDPLSSIASDSPQLQRLAIAPTQVEMPHVALTAPQHHYLCRVLRLRPGDRFVALDGQGSAWLAELSSANGGAKGDQAIPSAMILKTLCQASDRSAAKLSPFVTLLIAMPKQGMDEIIRQSTELGVCRVQPIVSDRTILKPSAQKVNRWRRIAAEAAEQSERLILPTVAEPMPWADYLSTQTTAQEIEAQPKQESHGSDACTEHRYLCVARRDAPNLLRCLHDMPRWQVDGVAIAIGPEGGWTEAEVNEAIAHGYCPVSLGRRILRAVTAPAAALALVMAAREFAAAEGSQIS